MAEPQPALPAHPGAETGVIPPTALTQAEGGICQLTIKSKRFVPLPGPERALRPLKEREIFQREYRLQSALPRQERESAPTSPQSW